MVETLTSYRATDGAIFPNAWEAWKHEFYCWLRANGIDNDAIAQKVVKSIDHNRPESILQLGEIVAGLTDHQPAPLPEAAPKVTPETPESLTAETYQCGICLRVVPNDTACDCHFTAE